MTSIRVGDLQLINLATSAYKILVKVLANKLSAVLGETISLAQSAFIEERQTRNAAFVAIEVVYEFGKRKEKGVLFKLDFEKAYDQVSWEFLDWILIR